MLGKARARMAVGEWAAAETKANFNSALVAKDADPRGIEEMGRIYVIASMSRSTRGLSEAIGHGTRSPRSAAAFRRGMMRGWSEAADRIGQYTVDILPRLPSCPSWAATIPCDVCDVAAGWVVGTLPLSPLAPGAGFACDEHRADVEVRFDGATVDRFTNPVT